MGRTRTVKSLLVGAAESREFLPVATWIRGHSAATSVSHPMVAVAAPTSLTAFRVIFLFQSRPGQYSSAGVDSLHRTWPLARLISVLGSWCEGDIRSRRPCPGVWRVPATNAIFRLHTLFPGTSRVASRSWQLPRLATEADRLECEASRVFRSAVRPAPIVVVTASRTAFEPLADLVCQAQFTPFWRRPSAACTESNDGLEPIRSSIAIWDAALGDEGEWEKIRRFAAARDLATIVVLLGFVRSADLLTARNISESLPGRSPRMIVIPKPFYAGELMEELVRATDSIDRTDLDGEAPSKTA